MPRAPWEEVTRAVDQVLVPDSALLKSALLRSEQAPAHIRDSLFIGFIAGPVQSALEQVPELSSGEQLMLRQSDGAMGLNPMMIAHRLVSRARGTNGSEAVAWLRRVLAAKYADGYRIMAVWGVAVAKPVRLSSVLELVPFASLPESQQKTAMEHPIESGSLGVIFHPFPMSAPSLGILAHCRVEPVIVNSSQASDLQEGVRLSTLLDETRLCLTVIGPSASIGTPEWFEFTDRDFRDIAMTGTSHRKMEILPFTAPAPTLLDSSEAEKLVPTYLALEGEIRNRIRISLERLNLALIRARPGDRATELSICLEVLLTDQQGENTWKVSLRAALLAGGTLEAQLQTRGTVAGMYRLRSAMMHHGNIPDDVAVPGQGRRASTDVLTDATKIAASVIRAVIRRGSIPDWPSFELHRGG
jgi:hypothetical protein